MQLSDFDFHLDDSRIALRPASPRHASKFLVSAQGVISDRIFLDLPEILQPGDLLILNNTKVIPGRLLGERRRETENGSGIAQIELTLLDRLSEDHWTAFAKPAKRLAAGDIVHIGPHSVRVLSRDGGMVELIAESEGALGFETLHDIGTMPLPPYIAKQRQTDGQDMSDYQTVFAEVEGAVAAPTASLHFDDLVFERLSARGINHAYLTLHVGAGTFLPVTEEDISKHKMHSEWYSLPEETVNAMNATWAAGGRVIPVGTTALRSIESAATGYRQITAGADDTEIFITPGYKFKATDGLITNFHLPKSTLLMLVAALAGFDQMKRIYDHALTNDYRFFSYGDSSLILP